MNTPHLSVALSLCFILNSACYAAAPALQGRIRFEGSIVERGCHADVGKSSGLTLSRCPTHGGIPAFDVQSVGTSSVGAHVNIRPLAASTPNGRDIRFEIVDVTGAPVRSGNYLITMTLP